MEGNKTDLAQTEFNLEIPNLIINLGHSKLLNRYQRSSIKSKNKVLFSARLFAMKTRPRRNLSTNCYHVGCNKLFPTVIPNTVVLACVFCYHRWFFHEAMLSHCFTFDWSVNWHIWNSFYLFCFTFHYIFWIVFVPFFITFLE